MSTKALKRAVTPPQAKSSLDNFKPLMSERAALHMAKKDIEEQIKAIDADLRPMLDGLGTIIHDGFSFKVTVAAGRNTVDHKKMAEDYGIDAEEYTKTGAPSSRFTIAEVTDI
jgi:hypothetical protein